LYSTSDSDSNENQDTNANSNDDKNTWFESITNYYTYENENPDTNTYEHISTSDPNSDSISYRILLSCP
jgi:hypothetical protein